MPKRVQSELNGGVFEATDFWWALLPLNRERMLTDVEMAASPAQAKEQDGLATWARTGERQGSCRVRGFSRWASAPALPVRG